VNEWRNEVNKNAKGGTEMMMERIEKSFPDLHQKIQLIPSRVRELDSNRRRILYLHDLPEDPESHHLANGGWKKFNKIVCCSYWQQQKYISQYDIPWSKIVVIKNAIDPSELTEEDIKDKFDFTDNNKLVNIVYHTTPHRGLEILVPVVEQLFSYNKNIHLHVFSSFEIYGWSQRDEPYKELFEKIKTSDNMTYYGYVAHEELLKHLKKMHIFAYPCIWQETSCISLMEAMSAGVACIHPNYGALYETSGGTTASYDWNENIQEHARKFGNILYSVIHECRRDSDLLMSMLQWQKTFADTFYDWNMLKIKWKNLFSEVSSEEIPNINNSTDFFSYSP